jgi:hypothetical protein
MGRALSFARSRDLPSLFAYFGLDARPEQVRAHADRIAARFQAELREIERRCAGLREKERFVVIRAALALAYESAALGAAARAPAPAR